MKKFFNVIGNILWLLFVGVASAVTWFVIGAFWCLSIIGIPFGLQCFKFGRLTIWPMGREGRTNFAKHPIANVIWLIFGGFFLAAYYFVAGIFLCITVIGIPFGFQAFKLGRLTFCPFGAEIQSKK